MKKIYRYLKFYIKTAFKNISRHLGLMFSAAFAVSITLILISLFMLLSANITNVTYNIEDKLSIRASIDNVVQGTQLTQLQNNIEAIPNVKKVSYSSGKEELEAYRKEYGDDNNLLSMYEGDHTPIRDAFLIEVTNAQYVESVSKKVNAMKEIVSAEYGGSSTDDMIAGMEMIRNGSLAFIIFLLVVAIFLISNKIKMSIYTRKDEIAIMRFVGTSNFSVKIPLMLEGMFIGFVGSFVPSILTIFGYQYLYGILNGTLLSNMFQLQPVFPLTLQISLLLCVIGMLVGIFGGFISTTRYLHWKR